MFKLRHLDAVLRKQKKRNKHRAVKRVVDGITFDSKKEAITYEKLKLMLASGKIRDLVCHPFYVITWPNGKKICKVELDFMYFDVEANCVKYIDVKAWDKKTKKWRVTNESKIKKRLVESQYNIEVEYV